MSKFARTRRFVEKRLSPQEALGLHVTIGVLIMIVTAWWFSEIAENLGDGTAQVALDHRVTNWFHAYATPGFTAIARAVTFCGSVGFVTAVAVGCAIFFAGRRAWNRLIAVALTMGGGSLLNLLLKHFFHRQRPVLENPLVTLTSYGFPSGHTMGSTLLYGLLALIALRFVRPLAWRIAIFAVAIIMIALVGLSRIYLGAHYLTDVLGAIAIGIAWLTFAWTTTDTFRKRSRPRAAAAKV